MPFLILELQNVPLQRVGRRQPPSVPPFGSVPLFRLPLDFTRHLALHLLSSMSADGPTRDVEIRATPAVAFSDHVSAEVLAHLHSLALSCAWVRLVVLLSVTCPVDARPMFPGVSGWPFCGCVGFECTIGFGLCAALALLGFLLAHGLFRALSFPSLRASLPQDGVRGPLRLLFWGFLFLNNFGERNGLHGLQPLPLVVFLPSCYAVPLVPQTADERTRADRRSGVNLAADRVLRPQARSRRDALLSWVTGEPGSHHPAMPAFSALALLWGWAQESAIFLLAWAGILRVGEVLNGLRSDFVLPSDSTAGIGYALFQIRHPKTRGSAAKHQSARIDPKDVISLLAAVFGNWPGDKKLWSLSGSTPRKRFNQLQHSLGLPCGRTSSTRPYDLASLRGGGATHLLQRFEDGGGLFDIVAAGCHPESWKSTFRRYQLPLVRVASLHRRLTESIGLLQLSRRFVTERSFC